MGRFLVRGMWEDPQGVSNLGPFLVRVSSFIVAGNQSGRLASIVGWRKSGQGPALVYAIYFFS